MSRRAQLLAFSLAQFVILTFFVAVAGPAQAADKDCGDFSTQKQAQLFFLNAGGPQNDPHYLDSDGDGEACESNPCPCYWGTQPPADNPPSTPPPPVKSSVDLSTSRTSGITGERVRFIAKVTPKISRPIVLQRKQGKRWVKVDSGKTSNDGRWSVPGAVRKSTTVYRAAIAGVKQNGKQYTAATSNQRTVKTLNQALSLRLSKSSVNEGARVVATADAEPARRGRPIVLQRRTNDRWVNVDTEKQDSAGEVRYVLDTNDPGTFRYRAVVQRFRGAVPFRSTTRAVEVKDTTPPGVPTGLIATPGDGEVSLDWRNVTTPDLRGYHVYSSTTAGGPWSQITAQPLSGSTYTAKDLSNGTEYYFCIRSVDDTGNRSACSTADSATPVAPDTTAPEAPQGLTASAGDGVVDLDWSDAAEPELAGYRVYVSPSADGPSTLLTTELLTTSSYRAEGLTNDTEYFFTVTAVDATGNESSPSEAVSATPTAPALVP